MAEAGVRSRRDDAFYPLRADTDTEIRRPPRRAGDDDIIDLSPYVTVLWAHCAAIVAVAVGAAALAMLGAATLMRPYYRAVAIIRPVPKAASAGRIVGLIGGVPTAGVGLGSMAGLMGGAGAGADEAQEYMTILQSFAFNTALIERHRLDHELFRPHRFPPLSWLDYRNPKWRAYKRMMKWFWCDYSPKTGNITLYFKARTPAEAEKILGFYIDDLREKLRNREVQSASAAIESMKTEARVTSDALLQTQLYELIAKQMQQRKLAQVEADFAFSLLEPPAAPDKADSPRIVLDGAVAGLLAFFVACGAVLIREARRATRPERRANGNADVFDDE